jgi:dipeptidyl aminopeptidase/acylaminoacyl peptidase
MDVSLFLISLIPVLFAQAILAVGPTDEGLETVVGRMARIGGCWSPTFSPDGKRIAFVSNMTGVPQVWTIAAGGGWPHKVTVFDDPVEQVAWSPDGKWLAVSMSPGGGMNTQIYLVRPDGSEITRITAGGKDNNSLSRWSYDGNLLFFSSSRQDPAALDNFVYDLDTQAIRLVAKNNGIGFLTGVNRNNEGAVLFRMRSRSDNNLILLDLENGKEMLLTPHDPPGTFGGGQFSPDGQTVYISSNKDTELAVFAKIRMDNRGDPGSIEVIASREDAELSDFEVTEDGSTAVLNWNVGGRNELAFVDLKTLESTSGPEVPAEIVPQVKFSKDGQFLTLTIGGSTTPFDIWIYERDSKKLRQLTYSPHPGVDLGSLVSPKLVRFRAHDGLALSGWLYLPQNGPVPMVLSFHGGPEGQERPFFRSDYQALLARGIGVFAPNVRGSAGFGKTFVNLDNGALRFDAIKDIKSSVEFVAIQGYADPNRIGIMGGSYGGYMTMAGLSEYPDLFAAGANLFGIVNFETFFAQTEPWMAAISTVEYGDPETELEMLRRLSPIHKLEQVKAPTIVLHGANDTNVPVVEAEQVVDNLKERGIPVEYVLFPDEGHGFRKEKNRITSSVEIVKWFERHLK